MTYRYHLEYSCGCKDDIEIDRDKTDACIDAGKKGICNLHGVMTITVNEDI